MNLSRPGSEALVLYRLERLSGCPIVASDGEVGLIKEVYFDEPRWTARSLAIDTGDWLNGRRVLIGRFPCTASSGKWMLVHVRLDKQRAEASPPIDTDKRVSRPRESDLVNDYGYPCWLPVRHLVVQPQLIKSVDRIERGVNVGVTRDIVEAAPEYHPDLDFSRAYAASLYQHYRRSAAGRPAK